MMGRLELNWAGNLLLDMLWRGNWAFVGKSPMSRWAGIIWNNNYGGYKEKKFVDIKIYERFDHSIIQKIDKWKKHDIPLWPSDTIWRHRYGSTLAQVMAWANQPIFTNHQWGLVAFICGQFPKKFLWWYDFKNYWLNSSPPSAANMRQWTGSTLFQIMACRQAITWTNTH